MPLSASCWPTWSCCRSSLRAQRRVEDAVDQRRLARARHAGHRDEARRAGSARRRPSGCSRARRRSSARLAACGASSGPRSARCRRGTRRSATPGRRFSSSGVPARTTTPPPRRPAPGPKSTTWSAASIVSASCSTTMHGVAEIAQPPQRGDQRRLSRWCRPIDGSSSMYITPRQLASRAATRAGCAGLAARQRRRRAIERQVVEPDVEQEAEPRVRSPSGSRRRSAPRCPSSASSPKCVVRLGDGHAP